MELAESSKAVEETEVLRCVETECQQREQHVPRSSTEGELLGMWNWRSKMENSLPWEHLPTAPTAS